MIAAFPPKMLSETDILALKERGVYCFNNPTQTYEK